MPTEYRELYLRLVELVEKTGAEVVRGDFVLRDMTHSPIAIFWPNGLRVEEVRIRLGATK